MGTPRVAASTMPTISPASMTSRRTMMKAPINPLLRDHLASSTILVELPDEIVGSGHQRPEADDNLAAGRDHLLDPKGLRFELLRRGILVVDGEDDALARRHAQLQRRELVVLDHD